VAIRREVEGVYVRDALGHWDRFDRVVLACHADQALGLLEDACAHERDLLSCFGYSSNSVWLHGDAALMPRRRSVWSSWNYVACSRATDAKASVTYWMNRLQNLADASPLFVSVNPEQAPDPRTVLATSPSTIQCTMPPPSAPSGTFTRSRAWRDTYFCGSYCGYGFHEDALSAGLDVAEQLGARRPWQRPDEHRSIGEPPRVVAQRPPFALPVAARAAREAS
jgi:predicted NAD/FAD-binding protein